MAFLFLGGIYNLIIKTFNHTHSIQTCNYIKYQELSSNYIPKGELTEMVARPGL